MRIGTLLLAAVVSATLVGCAPMEPRDHYVPNPARTQNCNTRDCPPLVVTVKENPAQHTCEAAVDDLNVSSGPEGERSVEWKIATPGYEFSKEPYKFAIFVKSNPNGKFKGANTSTSGQVLSLKFVHKRTSTLKPYEYVLAIRRSDGTFCETLDPWLIS